MRAFFCMVMFTIAMLLSLLKRAGDGWPFKCQFILPWAILLEFAIIICVHLKNDKATKLMFEITRMCHAAFVMIALDIVMGMCFMACIHFTKLFDAKAQPFTNSCVICSLCCFVIFMPSNSSIKIGYMFKFQEL